MNKVLRHVFSFLLALTMLIATLSTVFAAEIFVEEEEKEEEISVVEEVESLRDEYEKHFLMSDGSYVAASYTEPIHKMVDDSWVEVDNTLTLDSATAVAQYTTVNGISDVSFATKYQNEKLVTISDENYNISWSVKAETKNQNKPVVASYKDNNAKAVIQNDDISCFSLQEQQLMAEKSSSSVAYYDAIAEDVDLEYTVLPTRVKESIILNSPSDISTYVMNIYTENLTAKLLESKKIEFYDKSGTVVFSMWAPYMFDSNNELSEDISVTLEEKGNGLYVSTITPSSQWLNDPERVYPITIDPTVSVDRVRSNIIDNYVLEDSGNQNENLDRMYIGLKSGKKARAYIKYDTLPTLPKGFTLTGATQTVYILSGTTSANTANAYMVSSDWDSSTIKWSNKPSTSTTLRTNIDHHDMTYYAFACLSAVKVWYSGNRKGTNKNYGVMIRYSDETINDYNSFYSSDYSTESKRPNLRIKYTLPESDETIVWPVSGSCEISSPWGYRNFDSSIHKGIDITNGSGSKDIKAAISGKVAETGSDISRGNYVIIEKDNSDFQTCYYHLASKTVEEGDIVTAGDKIGVMGSTGNSTGVHLHFQIQWGEKSTKVGNPLTFYHQDDKRESWKNPNPMFYKDGNTFTPNSSFSYEYVASNYNSISGDWKK